MRYVMILYGINKPNVNLIGLSLFSFFGGEAAKKGEKEIFGACNPRTSSGAEMLLKYNGRD